ncbi:MAG TPA: anthranilate phosphoribosyltransferase [Crenotrichaceae bacterium]|nr:anthranilate phosphoribosyltransferase [Crenotrichaceae bacterium]
MESLFLKKICSGTTEPDKQEFYSFLDRVMQGKTARQEVVAFLAGLSARPLSTDCIVHFVSYIHDYSPPRMLAGSQGAVNIVGTGGGISTFNVSTAAAIVASAAGAKILKSGSTAYNSQCGSLDVLKALQVPLVKTEAELSEMIQELGIGFVPSTHYSKVLQRLAAMVAPLAFRDIAGFVNKVGPLLCPYQASAQVMGVSQRDDLILFSSAVEQLNCTKTLLVQAEIGMDEFSSIGINHCRLIDRQTKSFSLPGPSGKCNEVSIAELAGGSIPENTAILRNILSASRKGVARETVILNSAALLYMAGITSSIESGIQRAADAIDQGKAINQLQRIIDWGNKYSQHRASFVTAC